MGSITLNKPSGGAMTISPEDGTSTETITVPKGGIETVRYNLYGAVNPYSQTTKNTEHILLGPVTYNSTTTAITDTVDVSSYVTDNTIALIVYVRGYQGSSGSYHSYWQFEAYQSGEATKQAAFSEQQFNDYATTSFATLTIPWNKENSSTDLVIYTSYSLNTSSINFFNLYLAGTVEAG